MALFFGGAFNTADPIFNFPIYIWLWVVLVILAIVFAIIHHFVRWKPLAPFHALFYEWKNGGNVAFIFDGDLRGEMVEEKIAKCIFDYSKQEYVLPTDGKPVIERINRWLFYYPTAYLKIDFAHAIFYKLTGVNKDVEIAKSLQNGEWERNPSVICTGVPVDIVIDTDNWTIRASKQHAAIERAAELWNDANPTDQIHSYGKFQRYLISGKIACDGLAKTAIAPWIRIDGSFPTEMKENEWAGKKMQMAVNADEQDSGFFNSIGLKVLAGGVAFGILLIIIRFASKMFGV